MNKRAGQRFGHYSLVRLLGQGSISEIYLAEHVEHKAQVTIKILQMKLSGSDREGFLTQTRLLGRLKHPHIVRIWEAGIQGNTPFLAMTYAPHGSLRTLHPSGARLPQEQLLRYIQQMTSALQYLHDQHLLYHDLKPQNVLVAEPGKIVLADFALSLISKSSRSLNMQEMMGDIAYMAPEQLQGKSVPASDQYALGIIIYEWLSGTVPFEGTFTEVAHQHAFTPPTPLHVKVPGIAPAIEEVVQIALSKDPQRRFASVQAFTKALEQACQHNQPQLKAPTVREPERSVLPNKQENHQKPIASKQPVEQFSSDNTQTSIVSTLPSPTPPKSPWYSSRAVARIALLCIVALLVIVSGSGLLYLAPWQHSTPTRTQITATAQTAAVTATAQARLRATTIARADANTEATAEAAAGAEAAVTATATQNLYTQATQGTPIINDPLTANDKNSWDENTSSKHESCAFIGKTYHIINQQPPSYYSSYTPSIYPCFANTTNFSNFALQARVTILKGDSGGLVFLADSAHSNYCYFGLYNTGTYHFLCYINGYYTLGLNSQKTVVGNKSPQTNLLTVIVRNQNIFLYVNQQYVGSIKVTFLTTGEIGGFAEEDTTTTDVTVNAIQVWQL
jgi:serine/threonine protein kinase